MAKIILFCLLFVVGCGLSSSPKSSPTATKDSSYCSPEARQSLKFRSVFDGTEDSLRKNWHSWGEPVLGSESRWHVDNDVLKLKPGGKFEELVLNGSFRDFVFVFSWAVSPGANSGVKYNVLETTKKPIGLEYQILDDDLHPDARMGQNKNRQAAALYDIKGEQHSRQLQAVGAFNTGCIAFVNKYGEHWLNERLVLDFNFDDPDFVARILQSKFKNIADYNVKRTGQIFLQDHGNPVAFRDLALAVIDPDDQP